MDGDRGINNQIEYSIVQGPDDLFGITPESGIVYTQSKLDRESERSSNGAFILRIRAHEVGGEDLDYVETEVTIMIEVCHAVRVCIDCKNVLCYKNSCVGKLLENLRRYFGFFRVQKWL